MFFDVFYSHSHLEISLSNDDNFEASEDIHDEGLESSPPDILSETMKSYLLLHSVQQPTPNVHGEI